MSRMSPPLQPPFGRIPSVVPYQPATVQPAVQYVQGAGGPSPPFAQGAGVRHPLHEELDDPRRRLPRFPVTWRVSATSPTSTRSTVWAIPPRGYPSSGPGGGRSSYPEGPNEPKYWGDVQRPRLGPPAIRGEAWRSRMRVHSDDHNLGEQSGGRSCEGDAISRIAASASDVQQSWVVAKVYQHQKSSLRQAVRVLLDTCAGRESDASEEWFKTDYRQT